MKRNGVHTQFNPIVIFRRLTCWLVLMGLAGMWGCGGTSSARVESRDAGETVNIGGQKYKVRDIRNGGKSLAYKMEDLRRLQEVISKRLIAYGKKDPNAWKKSTDFLQKIGSKFVPESTLKNSKIALEQSARGANARRRLVKLGRMTRILLKLPSPNKKTWDQVRKRMLTFGSWGRGLFIQRMLTLLRSSTRTRTRAAEQLAQMGPEIIDNCWQKMLSLVKLARQKKKKKGTWGGVPVMKLMKGLSETIVFSENRKYIRKAVNYDSYRIRGAMARALASGKPKSWKIHLLGQLASGDTNSWVRGQAVAALGDTRKPEALSYLQQAIHDPEKYVGITAINSLTEFDQKEQKVVEILLYGLENMFKAPEDSQEERREKIFETLEAISGEREMVRRHSAWKRWYDNKYKKK